MDSYCCHKLQNIDKNWSFVFKYYNSNIIDKTVHNIYSIPHKFPYDPVKFIYQKCVTINNLDSSLHIPSFSICIFTYHDQYIGYYYVDYSSIEWNTILVISKSINDICSSLYKLTPKKIIRDIILSNTSLSNHLKNVISKRNN